MKVVFASNELGLGGTEKAMVTHALELAAGEIDVGVVAIHRGGEREAALAAAGIPAESAGGDRDRLADLLRGTDLVHVFRGGVAEPLLPEAVRDARVPRLVESNVFGAVDASADAAAFDCHLVPSKFCALRLRRRLGDRGPEFHRRHRVSYWPVDVAGLRRRAPEPADAKRALGLDPDRPVVGRIGRADDRKWRDVLVDMVPPLLGLAPEAQVMFVGPTPAKLRRLDSHGVLDRVRLFAPTADEDELGAMYAACDVFATAAEIGESHSYAIEEAMALRLPVVTCSTPWVDNAQIEQVDEGVTGHIANHPVQFAEAIASLLTDAEKRARFAAAAGQKSEALYDAGALSSQLAELYEALLASGSPPAEWRPSSAEVDGFADEYERRLEAHYRPMTPAERDQESADRRRERVRWALRAARSSLNPQGLRAVWWAARSRL